MDDEKGAFLRIVGFQNFLVVNSAAQKIPFERLGTEIRTPQTNVTMPGGLLNVYNKWEYRRPEMGAGKKEQSGGETKAPYDDEELSKQTAKQQPASRNPALGPAVVGR